MAHPAPAGTGQPPPAGTAPTPPTGASPAPPPDVPPRYRYGLPARGWLVIAGLVVLTVVAALLVARVAGRAARDAFGRGHVVSGALDGRRDATLETLTGTTLVRVRSADLGDRLFRASTPGDSGQLPRAGVSGDRVQISLAGEDRGGPAAVDIELNSRVRWRVRLVAGASEETVDLSSGLVAGIEIVGGVSRIELTLPRPDGSVAVRLSGGANQFAIHLPGGVPVRVRLDSGAANVTVDGATRTGLAAGTVVGSPEWDGARDRYDIEAAAGVSMLTVDRG
jgi:hypothetical protein